MGWGCGEVGYVEGVQGVGYGEGCREVGYTVLMCDRHSGLLAGNEWETLMFYEALYECYGCGYKWWAIGF